MRKSVRKMSIFTINFENVLQILTSKYLFMSIYVAKRPPELYKICNINFYKRKWPPLPFINFIKKTDVLLQESVHNGLTANLGVSKRCQISNNNRTEWHQKPKASFLPHVLQENHLPEGWKNQHDEKTNKQTRVFKLLKSIIFICWYDAHVA